jgi:hypothetical protein
MYGTLAMFAVLLVIAGLLVLLRPGSVATVEPFAVAAVNSILIPACTERSTAAQSLLARVATVETTEANQGDKEELRLLVSKLCCFEADINTPAAGTYRTLPLQFRTAHDMEPASTLVGRCLRDSLRSRDIELIMEKFETRGKALVARTVNPSELVVANQEFLNVTASLRAALQSQCLVKQPSMDTPAGPRDIGYWESQKVGSLSEYKGISASL